MQETGELGCSFCGEEQSQVRRLVAGPHVYICDGCVRTATTSVLAESTAPSGLFCVSSDLEVSCDFCSQRQDKVWRLLARSGHNICSECVETCNEILSQDSLSDAASVDQIAKLRELNRVTGKPARSLWKRVFHC